MRCLRRNAVLWGGLVAALIVTACSASERSSMEDSREPEGSDVTSAACGADTHMHLNGISRAGGEVRTDYGAAAETALSIMDDVGIERGLVMPPPISSDPEQRNVSDYSDLVSVAESNPDRFALVGGGGSLNMLIQQALDSGTVTADQEREFEDKADELVAAGIAAFGEMTALHLSFREGHPYEAAPPDHPLFLRLADIGADADVPIDVHMEAVVEDLRLDDLPGSGRFQSPPNPDVLDANIDAFERLLDQNPGARIVWAHVGWDNTGDMSVELLRRLLEEHSNLYLQLRVVEGESQLASENHPLEEGELRPGWKALITDFPDRFVLGSDQFYGVEGLTGAAIPSTETTWDLLDQLPSDLARQIACENPSRIYRLE